ncbi:hypothetical protein EBU99_09180 [bacterium]|nr:hypothetical protein [bacterium]
MSAIFVPTSNAGKLREFEHAFSSQQLSCIGLSKARSLLNDGFSWVTPIEDRETFVGNGYRKFEAAVRVFSKLTEIGVDAFLVDDSGLCVPRLNFSPGVHSATLAGEPRDDARNRAYLMNELKNKLLLPDDGSEPAFFVCSLLMGRRYNGNKSSALMSVQNNGDELLAFLEATEGKIMARLHKRLDQVQTAAYAVRTHLNIDKSHNEIFEVDLVMGFCTGRVAVTEQELLPGEGHGYDAMFFPSAKPKLSFASLPLAEKNQMSHRSEALRGLISLAKSHSAPDEIQELF